MRACVRGGGRVGLREFWEGLSGFWGGLSELWKGLSGF